MAGVGKTTSLKGLGHDSEIRAHFKDGVLFLLLGAQATEETVIDQLEVAMPATGATSSAEKVKAATSLAKAVSIAAIWFQGKQILFLVDDVWPIVGRPDGYLPDLKGILRGSPESRIAISMPSRGLAGKLSSSVDFDARDPQGPVSRAIFLSYVAPSIDHGKVRCQGMLDFLEKCAGLPISIEMAGKAVREYVSNVTELEGAFEDALNDAFEDACRSYLDGVSEDAVEHPRASFMTTAIRRSLAVLQRKLDPERKRHQYSVTDMYMGLSVF